MTESRRVAMNEDRDAPPAGEDDNLEREVRAARKFSLSEAI